MSGAGVLLMLVIGLGLTVWGGEWFVDAAVWLAEALGLPKFLIGATVVSLATTLPELAVSLLAAAQGAAGIAASNAVGSVAANLGLILGLCLLFAPGPADPAQGGRLLAMGWAAALLHLFCLGGRLGPAGALPLLAMGALYLALSARSARRLRQAEGRGPSPGMAARLAGGGKFAAGAAGIVLGARLLSVYGAALALRLGVPEGVVGATLVAVGTSLPELVTALTALRRGQAGLAVGNVVGANIIDLTLILPLCALSRGGSLPLPRQSLALDLPFCCALALLAAAPPLLQGRFRRWQGAALIGVYGAYVAEIVAARAY